MTDSELIKESIKGDHQAFKALVLKYGPQLLTTCRRYTPISIPPEDILQESFIKIYKNLQKIDLNKDPINYFNKICINTALSKQLKVKMHIEKVDRWHSYPSTNSSQFNVLHQLEVDDIISILKTLPKHYADVFNLIVIEGYSHKEVSTMLNISKSTSRVYLSRARTILQEKILVNEKIRSKNERV